MERSMETRQGYGENEDCLGIMEDAFVDMCDIEAAIDAVRVGGKCEVDVHGHHLKITVEHIDPVRICELSNS